MDIHKNARLTVHGRERIVRQVSCPDGFTATTGTDLMPVSAQSPPSAVSASLETTY